MNRNELQEHVFKAYIHLRYGMAVIGLAFPIVVYLAGLYDHVPLQSSISEYYWASGSQEFIARTWFVGGLFALAALLYLYKGFSVLEDLALNGAAILAIGVAIFPTPQSGHFSVHGFCAVSMFACLVYVVWFRALDTLKFLPAEVDRVPKAVLIKQYKRRYFIVGLLMAASPVTAFVLNWLLAGSAYIFFAECAGIWAFAAYWWIKSTELKRSGATKKALQGVLDMSG